MKLKFVIKASILCKYEPLYLIYVLSQVNDSWLVQLDYVIWDLLYARIAGSLVPAA